MEPRQPGQDDDERRAADERLGADVAEDETRDPDQDEGEPPPARAKLRRADRLSPLPHQVRAEERHEEAVRVVGIVPPIVDELGQDVRVEQAEQRPEEHDDEDGRRHRRTARDAEMIRCRSGFHSAHDTFAARTIIHIRAPSNIPTVLRSYIERGRTVG